MKDESRSAFPWKIAGSYATGLTKREWFAGMAMQGFLAGQYFRGIGYRMKELIQESYEIADEMLKTKQED